MSMMKKPKRPIDVDTERVSETVFKIPKGAHQIEVGFKKHRDDCPKAAMIFHLKREDLWAYVDFESAD